MGPADDIDVDDVELVARVLHDIDALTPVDEQERGSIEQFRSEVARLPRPFDERADPVHITGSAFIVGRRGIVLLLHRRLGIWVQPGGHVDPGEAPWDGARREAIEETGLPVEFLGGRIELAHVDVHAGGRGHTHLDLRYLFEAGDADPTPPPEESQDVRWVAWADAPGLAEPGMAGVLGALAARFGA
ncbi:MAG: NUDIX domain-containing protein [Ilumatobacteraceae bacterium]